MAKQLRLRVIDNPITTVMEIPLHKVILLLLALSLFGCISLGNQMSNTTNNTSATGNSLNSTIQANDTTTIANTTSSNTTNQTATSQANQSTPSVPSLARYAFGGFSFIYPENMRLQVSNSSHSGIFTGTHVASGQTSEIFIVTHINTRQAYGANKDDIFKANPAKTASDFLIQDRASDPAGAVLSNAYEVGSLSTFSVARDGSVAQQPLKIKFSNSNNTYFGYAINIYIPERSLHVKMRVVALDQAKANEIKDNFILSFRLENL
jgi:hypothetical protein